MQTVVETPSYLSDASDLGLTDTERDRIVSILSNDPTAGDLIQGTGGCRKMRFGGKGKGKSGGFRIITYYADPDFPVFVLTIFGKGERADLTQREKQGLRQLTERIIVGYQAKVVNLR